MKKFLVSMLVTLALPLVAIAQTSFTVHGVRLLKLVVTDDYRGAVAGKQHVFNWGVHDYSFDTQAHFLSREYREDPNSANAKYVDKWIRINGPTDRVGVDQQGKPFVDLGVFSDSVADIRAMFESDAAFVAGQEGPMICHITGMRADKPVLSECRYQYLSGAEYTIPPFIDQPVNDWLSDGVPPWFASEDGQTKFLFLNAFIANRLPAHGPCSTAAMTSECADWFEAESKKIAGVNLEEFKQAYKANQKFLKLPPLKR